MNYEIVCSACAKPSLSLLDFRCTKCGKPLEVHLNFDFETGEIRRKDCSVWRYAKFFPYVKEKEIVTLGEGWTPLVKFSDNVWFKLENSNPTGSFKDRGSTTLVSALRELIGGNEGYLSEDSSGNAGASIAAYAARAGLKAKIYVPQSVSGPKLNQIRFYGAEIVKVPGSRSKVAERAQEAEKGKTYVGHILHPLFRDGIRSLSYELAEQCHWHIPERIYLPVSAGTLLLGVIDGFEHLADSNVIETVPKIVACQTSQVSPLYHFFKELPYTVPKKIASVADALLSVKPPLLDLMVKRLKEVDGDAVMVEEKDIINSYTELARGGFFVEPSSAVAYAGYKKQLNNEVSEDDSIVVVLTGSGLKTSLTPNGMLGHG